MEIRIGIVNAPRELSFESDQSAAELADTVASALTKAEPVLSLMDNKGKKYLVPVQGIAYVELGSEGSRRVGFVG